MQTKFFRTWKELNDFIADASYLYIDIYLAEETDDSRIELDCEDFKPFDDGFRVSASFAGEAEIRGKFIYAEYEKKEEGFTITLKVDNQPTYFLFGMFPEETDDIA